MVRTTAITVFTALVLTSVTARGDDPLGAKSTLTGPELLQIAHYRAELAAEMAAIQPLPPLPCNWCFCGNCEEIELARMKFRRELRSIADARTQECCKNGRCTVPPARSKPAAASPCPDCTDCPYCPGCDCKKPPAKKPLAKQTAKKAAARTQSISTRPAAGAGNGGCSGGNCSPSNQRFVGGFRRR